ncbi:hypothetical protein GCM10027598_77130 [Amycolatopsis oliviviridis]
MPRISRPPESLLTVDACRATTHGRRRAGGVIIGPNSNRLVACAMAPSVVHGSAMGIVSATT